MNLTHRHESWQLHSGVALGIALLAAGLTTLAAMLVAAPHAGPLAQDALPAAPPVVVLISAPDTSVPDAASVFRGDDSLPGEAAPTF